MDPISLLAGFIAIVTAALQSSHSLYEEIKSFKGYPPKVQRLIEELFALGNLLTALKAVLETAQSVDDELISLGFSIKRCGNACQDVKEVLLKCTAHSNQAKASFRDWVKFKYMDGDINDFRDTISVYKSTISIALNGITLRKSNLGLEKLNELVDLVQETKQSLEAYRQDMDEKFRDQASEPGQEINELARRELFLEEEQSIEHLIDFCTQYSAEIEQHRQNIMQLKPELPETHPAAASAKNTLLSQLLLGIVLEGHQATLGCHQTTVETISTTLGAQLDLRKSLRGSKLDAPCYGINEQKAFRERRESIQQCLKFVERVGEDTRKERTLRFEDISSGDDSQQLITSEHDGIDARRIKNGTRSQQILGNGYSDSLRQVPQLFTFKCRYNE